MQTMKKIFEGQLAHLISLVILLIVCRLSTGLPGFGQGEWFGVSSPTWFWALVGVTIAHQVYVWLCWRLELHGKLLTRVFGSAGFELYAGGFAVLILARPVLITALAISNRGSLPLPDAIMVPLGVLLLLPAAYLGYSLKRYFGFRRAFGIDHFDATYRDMPLVKKGIFRFTDNGMYVYGFLLLWAIAVGFSSVAALVGAAFSHLYIWVHYYCTERPDMRSIYGE